MKSLGVWLALVLLHASACEKDVPAAQSKRRALALLCEAERHLEDLSTDLELRHASIKRWIDHNITNVEIRRLARDLPAAGPMRVAESARSLGIQDCPISGSSYSVRLPETTRSTGARGARSAIVAISSSGITIDGDWIMPVSNGRVADSDFAYYYFPRLTEAIARGGQGQDLLFAVDRATPYHTVLHALVSATRTRPRSLAMAARADGNVHAVGMSVPKHAPTADAPMLGVIVTWDELSLRWMSDPGASKYLLSVPRDIEGLRQLSDAVTEARATASAIDLMVSSTMSAQQLMDVVTAVQFSASGELHFSEVLLSSGVE